MPTPFFTDDCDGDHCQYVGSFQLAVNHDNKFDVYIYKGNISDHSLKIRYGNEGWEYLSGAMISTQCLESQHPINTKERDTYQIAMLLAREWKAGQKNA